MSEYTPITGELRGLLADMNWTEIIDHMQMSVGAIVDGDWLNHWHEQAEHVCDAIDSIHAQLERENAALKAELDRVLGEQEEHEHTRGESITDELREYATNDSLHYCSDYLAIADRIDAEHERQLGVLYRDMSDAEWVRLPVDADGVPIRVGDVMVYADGNTCPLPVVALVPPAVFLTDDGPRYADMCRHEPDTWERIIEDATALGAQMGRRTTQIDDFVARCKALCECTKEDA